MIIRKQKVEGLAEPEIVIMHSEDDDETAEKIMRILQNAEQKLLVTKDNVMSRIGLSEILYIEMVDRKAFIYTNEEVYESGWKISEFEDSLKGKSVFRCSRVSIINLKRVRSLYPEVGGRLLATMDNGERILISRQYAGMIKNELGVRK